MASKDQRRPDGGAAVNYKRDNEYVTPPRPENQGRPSLVDLIDQIIGGRWLGRRRALFEPLDPKPLALGITKRIIAELGLDRPAAREFSRRLGQWCGRPSYLEALSRPRALRYGLDGEPAEPVSPEHREAAREQLERYRQKYLARKAAARSACRANAVLPRLRLPGGGS